MAAMRNLRLAIAATIAAGSVCLFAQDAVRPEPAAGGSVGGFVRFAGGQAIADVRVSLFEPGARSARTTRTSVDGLFRFDAIPAGEYQLSVSHAGAVQKRIRIAAGSELRGIDFSIPDGGSRRAVTGRVAMNAAASGHAPPARIGVGVFWTDGTLVVPLAPGDQRMVVSLPPDYFLDSVTYGSEVVYSVEGVGGRRLTAGAFATTVPPEPQPIPELVVTLGLFR